MTIGWTQATPAVLAAFLGSLVEGVEALTVVLAVGSVRGWRSALIGCGGGLAVLAGIVAALGPALARVPLRALQLGVGTLLLLFGLRWLRKAILRAAGALRLRDESAAYAREAGRLALLARTGRWDGVAVVTSFNIVMLEGIEVVFIVIAIGAGGPGLLGPASLGALAAVLTVVAAGAVLHRPLARVPENALKLAVGILLSAFGLFWAGEGLGIDWPGDEWAAIGLVCGFGLSAALAVALCRVRSGSAASAMR